MKTKIKPQSYIPVLDLESGQLNILRPNCSYTIRNLKIDRGKVKFVVCDEWGDLSEYRTDEDLWMVDFLVESE